MHASSQPNRKDEGDSPLTFSLCLSLRLVVVHLAVCAMNGCSQLCAACVCGLGLGRGTVSQGANTKHLNAKSVISIPKSPNIEIRSSVQQRPIFSLIYHSCPCTQGLITPYMVNKPLTRSRQYDVQTKTMYLLYSHSNAAVCGEYSARFTKEEPNHLFWIILMLADVWNRMKELLYAESNISLPA